MSFHFPLSRRFSCTCVAHVSRHVYGENLNTDEKKRVPLHLRTATDRRTLDLRASQCTYSLPHARGSSVILSCVCQNQSPPRRTAAGSGSVCMWWQQSIPFTSKEIRAEFRKHDRSMRDSENLSEPLIVLLQLRRKYWSTLNSLSRALKLQMPSQKMHSIIAFFFSYQHRNKNEVYLTHRSSLVRNFSKCNTLKRKKRRRKKKRRARGLYFSR